PLSSLILSFLFFFFFTVPAPTVIYTLSLHDALPISFFIGAIAQALTTMVMYLIIGHPNWLILGCISGASSIIPYVGPIAANCLGDRKSTRLNSSHVSISYAVFCLKKKMKCIH